MVDNFEEYNRKTQGNPLGIVGFVLSLVCLTAIIGLPISIFALRRQPKGLAIAGTVLGALFLILQIGALVLFFNSIRSSNWETIGNWWEGFSDTNAITAAATSYHEEHKVYPTKISQLDLAEEVKTDPWGHNYRLVYMENPFASAPIPMVQSPGKDGKWNTEDDPESVPEEGLIDPNEAPKPKETQTPQQPTKTTTPADKNK